VDVVTWLLSRGKQRHGSAVQGNATPWYCQTAGDLNDLRASPAGASAQAAAAITPLRSDIGLVPAHESAMEPTSSQKITGAAGDLSCRRGE
jgi:hypothetical protein